MEQAGLGRTQRYGLDLGDFGERQPLAEEQLRGAARFPETLYGMLAASPVP